MKPWNKIFAVCLVFTILCTLFALTTFAEESEEPVDTAKTLTLDNLSFSFSYTSDSVVQEGLSVQSYTDPVSQTAGVELVPNFGIGYAIYDNPDTEIIDGIRINGQEVTSLRIPLSEETVVTEYDVAIRTVYVDTAAGSLAQILDGTYDYTQLITNPIIIFQLIYWAFMAISGIVGLFALMRGKGKKVKTSDEIAAKVVENVNVLESKIVDTVTTVVREEILPLAQASVKSGKEAVKAIVLSNSNSKDAPLALLDVFKDSEDIDVNTVVERVRESLIEAMATHEAKRAEDTAMLHDIANHVNQEDVEDATQATENKTHKSVF